MKKELFPKPVIATPCLSLLPPASTHLNVLSAKPPSLTPTVKVKKKLLLTVPNHVITMTKSNRAVDNVPGSTKRSKAFRISIE